MSFQLFDLIVIHFRVFFCSIQPNQSDPDLSIYAITLEYNDKITPITLEPYYINWIPQDKTQSVPPAPSQTSTSYQLETAYYMAYSFDYFIGLINTVLGTVFADLQTAVPLDPYVKNSTQPYLA